MTDLRYAIRQLIKSPGFTIVAVITLALGIGANSAIFSVIDTVLLRSLPFPNPDRLAMVWATAPQHPGEDRGIHSFPDYEDLRAQNHTLSALAAYTTAATIWGTGEDSADVPGLAATSDIFAVLGTKPLLGRGFSPADEKPGAARVVVISYAFWQKRFAGDPNIIGMQMKSSDHVYTITGVMPRGWKFPVQRDDVDYIAPLQVLFSGSAMDNLTRRGAHLLSVVGRLDPGADLRTATADLQTIAAQLAKQYPETNAGRTERAVDLQSDVVGDVRPALLVLSAAVALVLLIACANVANLFLARATGREREFAIRTALGAQRRQMMTMILRQSLTMAAIGIGVGVLGAFAATRLLNALLFGVGTTDLLTYGAVIVLLGVAGLIAGLLPARRAMKVDPVIALRYE